MFCINCGGELVEGAKFCPNCGANIAELLGESPQKTVLEKNHFDSEKSVYNVEKIVETKEKVIEDIFSSIFQLRGEFGKYVYIVGKDTISSKIQENMRERFLSGNLAEKPLLVFEYIDTQLNVGFVVTNQRLVWDYERGVNEIFLTDIKSVKIEQAGLAKAMRAISYNNEIYPKIYLTGISKEEEFVLKFKTFISAIHDKLGGNADNQKNSIEQQNVDIIIRACKSVKIGDTFCEVGNPTVSNKSKWYFNAKLYFDIPDDEEIYFIYDDTVMGSCKKGFALCSSGYYYCGRRSGYLSWKQFATIDVSKCFGGIRVGSEEFSATIDGKKLVTILKNIQENLAQH